MSEETKVTLEQVRAAIAVAGEQLYGEPWGGEDIVLAELSKPEIHPDVPVLYENRHIKRGVILGIKYYTDEEEMVDGPMENIRPLIQVDTAREAAYDCIRAHCDACETGNIMHKINAFFDTYLKEGPK